MPFPAMHHHHHASSSEPAHCPSLCLPPLQGTAVFSGRYSTQIGAGAHHRLRRSGFAGITSNPPPEGPMDLEDYDSLVFRCGRAACNHPNGAVPGR